MTSPSTSVAQPEYFNAYANFAFDRTESGVLTVRLHTDGGPVTFTGQTHSDFPRLLEAIAQDRANKVLVLTGTGDRFMTDIDGPSLAARPQLLTRYLALTLRQRMSRQMAEGTALGMALEGLTAANLAYC
jgi:enoyl-CoA hydratase/carnithine racemase